MYVNGTQVIDTKTLRDNDENAWQKAQIVDVASLLQAGANTIAVQVKNRLNPSGGQTPAGFIGRLKAGEHDVHDRQHLEVERHRA